MSSAEAVKPFHITRETESFIVDDECLSQSPPAAATTVHAAASRLLQRAASIPNRVWIALILLVTATVVGLTLTAFSTRSDRGRATSCTWAPDANRDCQRAIQSQVCHGANNKIRRVFLFGDSTMNRLFNWGGHRKRLVGDQKRVMEHTRNFQCRVEERRDRCNLNEQFGLPYLPNGTWTPPGSLPGLYEGPLKFGLETPYCQDCHGCTASLLECQPNVFDVSTWTEAEKVQMVYGGFIGLEFARDVEIQTPLFLTSQENVAYYLNQTWNTERMLSVFEKPTCIVNSGHHDVLIKGMTEESYVANVKWYLHLLAEQCDVLLWLATSSPETDDFPQKINATHAWGLAVKDMMEQDAVLGTKSVYIDVFEASRDFPHKDNSTWRTREHGAMCFP